MEIVGRGFLAGSLAAIAGDHGDVVALAAGVSCASDTSVAQFDREARLLYDTIRRCREGRRTLLFFSTGSTGMYGAPGCQGREDEPVFPGTPYGRHKFGLEAVLAQSTVDHLILRLSHVVGPHQPAHQLLPSLAAQIRTGTVRLHRGATRDLIGVDDVVTIVDRLLATGVRNEVVNVASGAAVPVAAIVDGLEARLGRTARRELVDARGNSSVSTAKLRRLVPQVAGMGFGAGYCDALLDRYVAPALAA